MTTPPSLPRTSRSKWYLVATAAVVTVIAVNIVLHWADFKSGFKEGFAVRFEK